MVGILEINPDHTENFILDFAEINLPTWHKHLHDLRRKSKALEELSGGVSCLEAGVCNDGL